MRLLLIPLLALGLAACQTGTAVEKEFVTVNVPVRAPCPDDDVFVAVMAALPTPLRELARPATEEAVRVMERAQLARYEAPGAFADQATAVIRNCHDRAPPLAPPP